MRGEGRSSAKSGGPAANRGSPARAAPLKSLLRLGPARPVGEPAAAPTSPEERSRHVELILSRIESLPTLSPIATRLLALTSADDADFDEIVALIEADMSLTARMIALCRRAATGVAETVTTVRRAVVLLGLEAVQSAVLSVSVFDVLSGTPGDHARRGEGTDSGEDGPRGFDRVGFWQHSVAVACCAELLARQHPDLKVRPDEAFTAGLVHDLGKVALEWILPRAYPRVLEVAEARSWELAAAERLVLGVDHHVAGKRLAEHWGLPYCLADTMWLHGQPTSAVPDVPHRAMVGLVTAADALCRRLHLGWSGCCAPAPSVEWIVQCVDLEMDRVSAIEPRLHESLAQRCADLGLGDLSSPGLMMQSIASANARLARLTQSLARRAQAGKAQAREADLLAEFMTRARRASASGGLEPMLSAIAWSVGRLLEVGHAGDADKPGVTSAIWFISQARRGEPWTVTEATTDGWLGASRSAAAPGAALLGEVAGDQTMAASADLLAWVKAQQDTPRGEGAKTLDLRHLRRTTLLIDQESAVLMLLDRELPEGVAAECAAGAGNGADHAATGGGGRSLASALTMAWAWAAATGLRQSGDRRLSEALAQANRALVQMQRDLAEAQSMARLGELAAGAAHEMNNPLTVISGRTQLLAHRLGEGRDRDDAQAVAAAATHLTNLITGLHTLASPPAPVRRGVNLRDLVERSAKRARARVGADGGDASATPIRVTIGSPMELAWLDEEQMERALTEVLTNALQAGSSSIGVTVTAHLAEDRLTITVTDDGCGLSEHAQRHAFDPFFSERPAGRRTGLGLAIARRFVSLNGGDVTIRGSQQGERKGTTVVMEMRGWRMRDSAVPVPAAKAA